MKKLFAVICGIAVLSMTGVAFSGQESGFYLGGSLGSSKLNFDGNVDFDGFDDDDLGWKIFTGFNFGIIPLIDLGIEGSYVDFGEASSIQINNYNVGVTGWDLFGVGAVNLGPVGVFGKVGQVWWDSKSGILHDILERSGSDMAYGLGVRIQFGSLSLRGEYERFDIEVADIDYISVGLSWTF